MSIFNLQNLLEIESGKLYKINDKKKHKLNFIFIKFVYIFNTTLTEVKLLFNNFLIYTFDLNNIKCCLNCVCTHNIQVY